MLECVTESQVQKTAHAMGYYRCVACRKLFLTHQAVTKRLRWAHVNNGRDWGGNVCWTDESSIELGERPSHAMVTHLPGEEFLPENISPTFKSGRKSIMVWACVTHNRKGPIIRLNLVPEVTTTTGKKKGGGLNGPRYVDQILDGPLKDFLDEIEEEEDREVLVVEDGAPCHQSAVAKNVHNELRITNLEHPPSLPDLNPIEPLWLILKTCVADILGLQNSLDGLWAAVQQVWEELSIEDVRKHTSRMQD